MATMHSLFLGVLSVVVCSAVSVERGSVKTHNGAGLAGCAGAGLPTSATATHYSSAGADLRTLILSIASAEIGVREATGHNDGSRVAEYLRYTGLGSGHEWCAAFVCWCYGQAGLPEPCNPWSPALFPQTRTYWKKEASVGDTRSTTRSEIKGMADIFGIYGAKARRINHVGLVKACQERYVITIEGNVDNKVLSKRRHLSTVYAFADWIGGER